MAPLPWRTIIGWAAIGWIICLALTLANLSSTSETLGGLVDARHDQPTAPLLQREIGDSATRDGGGHDGAFFYALAESPFRVDQAAPFLDRPRYRAQRILFPAVVWVAHPTGGGPGLVFTMFVIGALGILAGGIAMGALSAQLGGSARWGVAFGLLPGAWISLRISTPDPLALALALGAVLLLIRGRLAWAVVLGVLAVLTKEPVWLVLAGTALYQRDRRAAVFAGVPALVAAGWWLYLEDRCSRPAPETWSSSACRSRVGRQHAVLVDGNEPLGMVSFVWPSSWPWSRWSAAGDTPSGGRWCSTPAWPSCSPPACWPRSATRCGRCCRSRPSRSWPSPRRRPCPGGVGRVVAPVVPPVA